jgi:hypothetical protein
MKLTDKCKTDFENWYLIDDSSGMDDFNKWRDVIKYAFYHEFFLEKGIVLDLQPNMDYGSQGYYGVNSWSLNIVELGKETYDTSIGIYDTIHEARNVAIVYANNIYNESI